MDEFVKAERLEGVLRGPKNVLIGHAVFVAYAPTGGSGDNESSWPHEPYGTPSWGDWLSAALDSQPSGGQRPSGEPPPPVAGQTIRSAPPGGD
jgi:hypothetical protein